MTRRGCGVSGRSGETVPRRECAAGRSRLAARVFTRAFLLRLRPGMDAGEQPVCVERRPNLTKLPADATAEWLRLRPQVMVVDDVVSMDRPVIFAASKDRPILFSALAWSEVLLTLDKTDFADLLGGAFYGLTVLLPYDFLARERAAGRL